MPATASALAPDYTEPSSPERAGGYGGFSDVDLRREVSRMSHLPAGVVRGPEVVRSPSNDLHHRRVRDAQLALFRAAMKGTK